MDLSIVILTINEKDNLLVLLPRLRKVLGEVLPEDRYEIVIVDGGSTDGTVEVARELADRVIKQTGPGYGQALRDGFAAAQGDYIGTLDADLSHEPSFLLNLWRERQSADVLIASRYVAGGGADMPRDREILSRILNLTFRTVLALDVLDMSSGFRLYNAHVLRGLPLQGVNFDILPEIIMRSLAAGWRVRELPFHYTPRKFGGSKARLFKFARAYLTTLHHMWRLRNSIDAADYDERAYNSRIFFQRYWQRRRHAIIMDMVPPEARTLDIGCGSSRILHDLNHTVGLDIKLAKLRYMRRYDKQLVNGTLFALPFADQTFDCVICSQVIEHIAYHPRLFGEMGRVLRQGGTLILGTPDYGSWLWRTIEAIYKRAIPGGYADEHITHYTRQELEKRLAGDGFRLQQSASVLGSEMILRLVKVSS